MNRRPLPRRPLPRRPAARRPLTALLAAVLSAAVLSAAVLSALVGVAAPAQAASYRYWGYYQLAKGAWAFAQKGPDQVVPADGAVEGWRFAVADESSNRTPRAVATFDQLCAATPATAGAKRVGLVVDFGRPADGPDATTAPPAPKATCVSVPPSATGTAVLVAAGVTVRAEKGLTCALDGWPATGCGDEVKTVAPAVASPDTSITLPSPAVTAAADREATSSGPGAATLAGIAVVVLALLALGLVTLRRRRTDGARHQG